MILTCFENVFCRRVLLNVRPCQQTPLCVLVYREPQYLYWEAIELNQGGISLSGPYFLDGTITGEKIPRNFDYTIPGLKLNLTTQTYFTSNIWWSPSPFHSICTKLRWWGFSKKCDWTSGAIQMPPLWSPDLTPMDIFPLAYWSLWFCSIRLVLQCLCYKSTNNNWRIKRSYIFTKLKNKKILINDCVNMCA